MLLPLNCTVDYIEGFLSPKESLALYTLLIEQYKLDKARTRIEAGGRIIETDVFKILFSMPDLIARNTHPEHIHGKSYPFEGLMQDLKDKVEKISNQSFDLAMCLYYPDGSFYAPYHSDQQTSGVKTILPSLSLGEVREFSFRDKETESTFSLDLANGSLLIMGENCQKNYEHSLIKNEKYQRPRINITFREAAFQ